MISQYEIPGALKRKSNRQLESPRGQCGGRGAEERRLNIANIRGVIYAIRQIEAVDGKRQVRIRIRFVLSEVHVASPTRIHVRVASALQRVASDTGGTRVRKARVERIHPRGFRVGSS